MWNVLHLIARPIAILLGVFCVLTAIFLYPNEEGKIQSKFEDFWVRIDDYRKFALSRHAAFMQQVARFESSLLDRIFGHSLISLHSVLMSYYLSYISLGVSVVLITHHLATGDSQFADEDFRASLVTPIRYAGTSLVVLTAYIYLHKFRVARICIAVLTFVLVGLDVWFDVFGEASLSIRGFAAVNNLFFLIGGPICDIVFIIVTRRLIQWAGEMTRSLRVVAVVVLNCLLAATLVGPMFYLMAKESSVEDTVSQGFGSVAETNLVDAALALLFVFLAVILLIHRAIWPLLTRTLFRMTDIGTKGRRAILTTVGFALLAAGISGKVPELLQKLIEKL